MDSFPAILSNNISLNEPRFNHVNDLYEIYSDFETMKMLGLKVINQTQISELISFKIKEFKKFNEIYFVISHNVSKKVIGFITLYFAREIWQIEFAINKGYRRKGYCIQAIKEVLYFMQSNGIKEVYAHTKQSNIPSQNILLKSSFKKTQEKILFNLNESSEIGFVYKCILHN